MPSSVGRTKCADPAGLKARGVSVFAIGSVEQGTVNMCEEGLRQPPKDASLEAVVRGFMR